MSTWCIFQCQELPTPTNKQTNKLPVLSHALLTRLCSGFFNDKQLSVVGESAAKAESLAFQHEDFERSVRKCQQIDPEVETRLAEILTRL